MSNRNGDGTSANEKWKSWLIPLFVLLNVLVFATTMFLNDCPNNKFNYEGDCVFMFLGRFSFQALKENPLLGPSAATLEKMGALELYDVVHWHENWRLFTVMWLHGGVLHLLLNMLCLIFIGIRLERQFGFVKVGVIYLLSGFGGAIVAALFLEYGITVGASGCLFGLVGSMISELLTNWRTYTSKGMTLLTLGIIIVANLTFGTFPIIDNYSHIGAFLTGFLLGFVLLLCPQYGWVKLQNQSVHGRVKTHDAICQYLLPVGALILLVVGISVGLVMVFRGVHGNDYCNWCHYVDCVPTSNWKCYN